jgi:hypothetical protein
MTTNKARIAKAERIHMAKANKGAVRIFIYNGGEDMGRLGGVPMSCAEWDKIKKVSDVTLVIKRASEVKDKDGDE